MLVLPRSQTLRHPSGVTFKTPLLVPSFSSKGFRKNRKGRSEVWDVFANTAEFLTEAILVSAYDVFYKHLPRPNRFPYTPKITIVDSGGYEIGPEYDFSAVYRYDHRVKPWGLTRLKTVLDSWPEHMPAVFVSCDKVSAGKSLAKQASEARALFERYPKHLHNFLMKPSKQFRGSLRDTIKGSHAALKQLRGFHIVGVAEKELGSSMLERMETLATLRRMLDDEDIRSPIQVFGALDPVCSCLYLLAGAEIFDGLTWLRFAYSNGQCTYLPSQGVLMGLDSEDDFLVSKILSDNYSALRKLQLAMRDFVATSDFRKLEPHAEFLQKASDSLSTRVH
jgi:hypothetical protein